MSLRLMVTEVDSLGLVALLFSYLPWLLTWLAFTLLYVAVPNCKVRVVYAAFGGLITTLLFETAKALFGQLVAHSIYTNVYGAFAVIPLFLIWIYLLWMLILFGAELVRSLETFQYQGRDTELPDLLVKAHPWIASYDGLMRENRQMTEQNMTTSLQKLFSSNNYSQDAGDLNEN